jgi:hypothetical protein
MNQSTSILSATLIAFLFVPQAFAQGVQVPPTKMIHGSVDPSRIPDSLAWWMLFQALADRPGALPEETRRAFLQNSGFTDLEKNRIFMAANEANARCQSMLRETTARMAGSPEDQVTDVLRADRERILREVVDALKQRLGPEGAERFRRHVDERVKPRIRTAAVPEQR